MKTRRGAARGAGRGRGAQRRGESVGDVDEDASSAVTNQNAEVSLCGTCEKPLGEESIGCDECEDWLHNTDMCTGLTQDILDAIGRYNGQGIKFVCTKCRLKSSRPKGNSTVGNSETHIVDMVSQLFQQLRGICNVVQSLAEEVKLITSQTRERSSGSESSGHPRPAPNAQSAQSSMTYASVTASPPVHSMSSSEDYRKVVREELRELEEQRKRKNSLVIRGLQASSAREAVAKFETLSQHLIQQKVTLTDVVRISSETDLYRGKVSDDELKKCLLDKAKQLKNSGQYNSVYIRRDLTFKQRQVLKARRVAATAGSGQAHGTHTAPPRIDIHTQSKTVPSPSAEVCGTQEGGGEAHKNIGDSLHPSPRPISKTNPSGENISSN